MPQLSNKTSRLKKNQKIQQRVGPFQLRQLIQVEEFDYLFLKSILSNYSGIRTKIGDLLHAKVIIRVKKGLYVFGPKYNLKPICKETIANLIYGPSYLSLEFALSYYGLIPERVHRFTSVTLGRSKVFNTPLGVFEYNHLQKKKYSLEIRQIWVDADHPILIASAEKALCDMVVLRNLPPISSIEEAKNFLLFDVRISEEKWSRLKIKIMKNLNRIYNHSSLFWIIKALTKKEAL